MDSASHMIAAMRDRHDRIACVLWAWLCRHGQAIEGLADLLGCDGETLARLAQLPLPHLGADWDDDVEIIEISLRLRTGALRALLLEHHFPRERELGA